MSRSLPETWCSSTSPRRDTIPTDTRTLITSIPRSEPVSSICPLARVRTSARAPRSPGSSRGSRSRSSPPAVPGCIWSADPSTLRTSCSADCPSCWSRARPVLAAYAASLNPDDPLSGLVVGDRPDPEPPAGWAVVAVKAAALNHHDLWSLRGQGLAAEQLPMILGCDAAGLDEDGNEVIVHAVISSDDWRGDETLDPRRSLLSERHQGALAEKVAVPRRNLVRKPPELSFEHAACLPTAWLTAYRMLFTRARAVPGMTVLVQGAGGGVATALTVLGAAAGLRVWVTSRSEEKRARRSEEHTSE